MNQTSAPSICHGFFPRGFMCLGALAILITVTGCGPGNGTEDGAVASDRPTPGPAPSTVEDSAHPGTAASPAMGNATIAGRVVYDGEVPSLQPLRMDADPQCAAKHSEPVLPQTLVLGEGQALANVLVRVVGGLAEGMYSAPGEPVTLDQRGCIYQPHVLAVVAGQGLRVLNSDGLLHNVHSLSKVNPPFNRAMPGSVNEATFTLSKPEPPFRIKCDVHPWMAAYVSVLEHPFSDVSDEGGSFSISGLPAGTYQIEAWHERLGSQTASVMVADGETAVTGFVFSR